MDEHHEFDKIERTCDEIRRDNIALQDEIIALQDEIQSLRHDLCRILNLNSLGKTKDIADLVTAIINPSR
jgi:predicted RNase H-like nuclease (RuvC/YqgF family)